jgi:hypothetical protein
MYEYIFDEFKTVYLCTYIYMMRKIWLDSETTASMYISTDHIRVYICMYFAKLNIFPRIMNKQHELAVYIQWVVFPAIWGSWANNMIVHCK